MSDQSSGLRRDYYLGGHGLATIDKKDEPVTFASALKDVLDAAKTGAVINPNEGVVYILHTDIDMVGDHAATHYRGGNVSLLSQVAAEISREERSPGNLIYDALYYDNGVLAQGQKDQCATLAEALANILDNMKKAPFVALSQPGVKIEFSIAAEQYITTYRDRDGGDPQLLRRVVEQLFAEKREQALVDSSPASASQ